MGEGVGTGESAKCTVCGEVKSRELFSTNASKRNGLQSWCKACTNSKQHDRDHKKDENGVKYHRKRRLRNKYDMEATDYWRMYAEQSGRCAICGEHKAASGFGQYTSRGSAIKNTLLIDHVHGTKQVRSLLCGQCNILVGFVEKRRELLLPVFHYIRVHKQQEAA